MTASPDEARQLVRVRFGAITLADAPEPFNSVHYRIVYPALFTNSQTERLTGSLPPDPTKAPWPVAIMLGGINVNPDSYAWLAHALADIGVATVIFNHVCEVTPGEVGLSPGLDLGAVAPDTFGTRPSATAIGPILSAVAQANAEGPLATMFDLTKVAFLGHSAGGTVALMNATPDWFDGVLAAVSYAGHTIPVVKLGHPRNTALAPPHQMPCLVMGGGNDDVIAASISRYQADPTADMAAQHNPILATFEQTAAAPGSTLAILETATHLTLCHPHDPTSARGFLEAPDPEGTEHRALIAGLIIGFLTETLQFNNTAPSLAEVGKHGSLSHFERR